MDVARLGAFLAHPSALQGSDILGVAQTGTGKTAAFTLPILQKLNLTQSRDKFRHPRVIILSPTRELAIQINNSIKNSRPILEVLYFFIHNYSIGQS